MRDGLLKLFVMSVLSLLLFSVWGPVSAGGEKVEVIYVGDPMCSWCYGFTPEFSKFYEAYRDKVDFRLLMGGLRPYTKEPMNSERKEFLKAHWADVGRSTGQPFNFDILEIDGFVYDTERAARAVVVVQEMSPEDTYAFFKSVQHTFYVENKNTNDVATYVDLLPRFGIDGEAFTARYESDEYKLKTRQQFSEASSLGAVSFPTILIRKGDTVKLLARGYTPADVLGKRLESEL
jgi:putative protein-disulfide isomerase